MLWIKIWTKPIWRVDSKKGENGKTLKNIYNLDKPTYFLTDPDHAQSYIDNYVRKNTSGRGKLYFYIKKFIPLPNHPLGPVRLLDMGKADTVRALLDVSLPEDAEAIKTSFQIQADDTVKRYSERETKHIDDKSLAAICRYCKAQFFDGYYIDAPGLHPEIGLCPESFGHFVFDGQIERIQAAAVAGRKRTRNNRGNNSGNRNTTIKRMKFGNNNNRR